MKKKEIIHCSIWKTILRHLQGYRFRGGLAYEAARQGLLLWIDEQSLGKDFYTLLWTDEHTYPSDDNEDAAKLNLQVKNMNLSNKGSKGGYLDCMN